MAEEIPLGEEFDLEKELGLTELAKEQIRNKELDSFCFRNEDGTETTIVVTKGSEKEGYWGKIVPNFLTQDEALTKAILEGDREFNENRIEKAKAKRVMRAVKRKEKNG